MGIRKRQSVAPRLSSLADVLFSKTQQRVLGALFGQPDRSFYANELIASIGGGSGAVHRELVRLEASGLINARRIGNQKHYQADRDSPIFAELRGITLKMSGVQTRSEADRGATVLRVEELATPTYAPRQRSNRRASKVLERLKLSEAALAAFCKKRGLRKLSFFGSVTRADFASDSDVDVMVEYETGRKPDLFGIVDIKEELSTLFHGRSVDVITTAAVRNPFRRQSIERDLLTAYVA